MKALKVSAVVVALALTAACADQNGQGGLSKQTGGAVLGGIGGAAIGSAFGGGTGRLVGVAAGTLLGAFLGSEVGKSLDKADHTAMSGSTERALETGRSGEAVSWRNPDSGNYGTVTPQPAVQTATGDTCREYQQTVTVGGKTEQAWGRACRQPDGSWRIVNN